MDFPPEASGPILPSASQIVHGRDMSRASTPFEVIALCMLPKGSLEVCFFI